MNNRFWRGPVVLYNLGASLYDLLTTQEYWAESVRRLAGQFQFGGPDLKILDLGCGAGVSTFAVAERFAEAEVVGIDIAEKMIEKACFHHRSSFPHLRNLRFEQADAAALPFESQTFDIAIGHSFLYLVPQPERILREANRVLKRGGQLVLMEPHADGSLWRTLLRRTDYVGKLLKKPGPTFRFILSIVAWRTFSSFQGQISPRYARQLFEGAGFERISTRPTLDHLGLFCIGFAD